MVHAQQVDKTRAKRKSRDVKRPSPFDDGSSKSRLDIQDNPLFNKRSLDIDTTKFPKARDDTVPNPKSQKGKSTSSRNDTQLVESVARNIIVIALFGTIALGVARVATRLGISLM